MLIILIILLFLIILLHYLCHKNLYQTYFINKENFESKAPNTTDTDTDTDSDKEDDNEETTPSSSTTIDPVRDITPYTNLEKGLDPSSPAFMALKNAANISALQSQMNQLKTFKAELAHQGKSIQAIGTQLKTTHGKVTDAIAHFTKTS